MQKGWAPRVYTFKGLASHYYIKLAQLHSRTLVRFNGGNYMGAVAFKSLVEEQKTVITALIKEFTENFKFQHTWMA